MGAASSDRKVASVDVISSMVIRVSRSGHNVQKVLLSRDGSNGSVVVNLDRHTEGPEYVCVLLPKEDKKTEPKRRFSSGSSPWTKLFKEVLIDELPKESRIHPFSRTLGGLKSRKPSAFLRSIAFVLHVSRSSRTYFSYNWDPSTLSKVLSRLSEINSDALRNEKASLLQRQTRCLPHLSHIYDLNAKTGDTSKDSKTDHTQSVRLKSKPPEEQVLQPTVVKNQPDVVEDVGSISKKFRRPISIRRPKLKGKSADVDIRQAIVSRRAEASTQPTIRTAQSRGKVSGKIAAESTTKNATLRMSARKERQSLTRPFGKKPAAHDRERKAVEKDSDASVKSIESSKEYPSVTKSTFPVVSPVREVKTLSWLETMPLVQDYVRFCQDQAIPFQKRIPLKLSQALMSAWKSKLRIRTGRKEMNFVVSQSIVVKSISCEVMEETILSAEHLSRYLAHCIVNAETDHNVFVPMPAKKRPEVASEDSAFRTITEPVYVMKDLHNLLSYVASIVVEISILQHMPSKRHYCRYRLWLLRSISSVSKQYSKQIKHRKLKPNSKMEKESSVLDFFVTSFVESLFVPSRLFNFACCILGGAQQKNGDRDKKTKHNIACCLRETIKNFPYHKQERMPRLTHRLMKRHLRMDSFHENDKLSSFTCRDIFLCIDSNPSEYSVVGVGVNEKCLAGVEAGTGKEVQMFVCMNENETGFDLFILCRNTVTSGGSYLDTYTFDKDSPFAIKISDRIGHQAEEKVRDNIRLAARALRRGMLWSLFSSVPTTTTKAPLSCEELHELCSLVAARPLDIIDTRVKPIFTENEGPVIEWQLVISLMTKDPTFSQHWFFEDLLSGSLEYLFYFSNDDMFLLLEINESGCLCRSDLLSPMGIKPKELSQRAGRMIEMFMNWLLQFLWHQV